MHAMLAIVVAALGLGLLYPLVLSVGAAFADPSGGLTFAHVRAVLDDPATLRGLGNSTLIAALTTALAAAIATPLAAVGTRCSFAGKGALTALVLVPLVLPPFVGAIGLRHVLGRMGALNAALGTDVDWLGDGGIGAIVVLQAFALYPVMYLNLSAAFANLDPSLEDAARCGGAGGWRRFRRVTLPLIRPGAFAGATIVFIWAFTELGTPLMLDFHETTAVQVFNGIREVEASRRPYALVAVMLACSVGFYALGKWALGRVPPAPTGKASVAREERRLSGWRAGAAGALFAVVGGVACMPALGVVLASVTVPGQWYGTVLPAAFTGDHYVNALSHPLAAGSIRTSLGLSLAATVLSLAVGFVAARILVRHRPRGTWALDALVMLPLAVPGIVLAFGYVAMSVRWPFWGAEAPLAPFASVLGADPSPFPFLVTAYAVRRLPYVVRSVAAGLEQSGEELEDAARVTGASPWRVQWRVVAPLVGANLAAGALLAFSFSMLEVSDGLVLAQREAQFPVTKAIYSLYERLGDGPGIASAMGVWAMALLAVALLGASALIGRRMGAMFRG